MNDRRSLTVHGRSAEPTENIQDAEFVEVDPVSAAPETEPANPPTLGRFVALAAKIVAVVVVVLIVGLWLAGPVPDAINTTSDENATASDNEASTDTQNVTPISQLLASNDARACNHPDTVAAIQQKLLPKSAEGFGLNDEEFQQAIARARADLTEVTASNIRSEVHEITCSANVTYGDDDSDKFPISYTIRPSADPDGPAIYYFNPDLIQLAVMQGTIMRQPIKEVKSARPASTPAAETSPSSSSSPAADHDDAPAPSATSTPTDQDLYAPHG